MGEGDGEKVYRVLNDLATVWVMDVSFLKNKKKKRNDEAFMKRDPISLREGGSKRGNGDGDGNCESEVGGGESLRGGESVKLGREKRRGGDTVGDDLVRLGKKRREEKEKRNCWGRKFFLRKHCSFYRAMHSEF